MTLIGNKYREPRSQRMYRSTGKIPEIAGGTLENSYWYLSGIIESTFGDEGATIADIYHEVTGPKGMSLDDTRYLVNKAVQEGYLK